MPEDPRTVIGVTRCRLVNVAGHPRLPSIKYERETPSAATRPEAPATTSDAFALGETAPCRAYAQSLPPPPTLDRRAFLAATGAVGLAAGVGFALRPETDAHAAASAADRAAATEVPRRQPLEQRGPGRAPRALHPGHDPRLGRRPPHSSGYRRLGDGPAWRRGSSAATSRPPSPAARPRRTALAVLRAVHRPARVDVQHPLRLRVPARPDRQRLASAGGAVRGTARSRSSSG